MIWRRRTVLGAFVATASVAAVVLASKGPHLHEYIDVEAGAPSLRGCVASVFHSMRLWLNLALHFPRVALVLVVVPLAAFILLEMWRAIVKCYISASRRVSRRFRSVKQRVGERSKAAKAMFPHVVFATLFLLAASVAPGATNALGSGASFGCIAVVVPGLRALWALREHAEATAEAEQQVEKTAAAERATSADRAAPVSWIASAASSVRRRLSKTPLAAASSSTEGGGSSERDAAFGRASPAVRARLALSAREIAHWLRYFTVGAFAHTITLLPIVFRFLSLGADVVRGAVAHVGGGVTVADQGWFWWGGARAPWDLRWAEGRLALALWLQLRWTNGATFAMGAVRPLARCARAFPRNGGARSNVILNGLLAVRLISDRTRRRLQGMFEDAGTLIVLSVFFLLVPGLARCGCTVVGVVAPAIASAAAVYTEFGPSATPLKTKGGNAVSAIVSQRWLEYWVIYVFVFGLFLHGWLESPASGVLGWAMSWVWAILPFRYHLELICVDYLALRGSARIISGIIAAETATIGDDAGCCGNNAPMHTSTKKTENESVTEE